MRRYHYLAGDEGLGSELQGVPTSMACRDSLLVLYFAWR